MWFSPVSFFFSSRRRHTRFDCDWSSDVCSSDLLSPTHAPTGSIESSRDETAILVRLPASRAVARISTICCWISGTSSLKRALTKRSEEHTSELQSQSNLVCRLLLEKKKKTLSPALHLHNSSPLSS